jgi:hypothetical protein
LDQHIEVPEKLIPSIFEEETNLLDSETMLLSKIHYATHYRSFRKEFLNNLEVSMTHRSLIESTVSRISKKYTCFFNKMSSPSVLTVNTEISKISAKLNAHDFYSKNFNHAFLPKPEFKS